MIRVGRSHPHWVVLWAVLAAFSHLLFAGPDALRYPASGAALIAPATGAAGDDWIPSHSGIHRVDGGGVMTLVMRPGTRVVSAMREVPVAGVERLRLSAEIKGDGLDEYDACPKGTRLMLVGYDQDGRARFEREHLVTKSFGTFDWQGHTAAFGIQDDIVRVRAGILTFSQEGSISVRGLALTPVKERAWFGALRWCLSAAWLVMLIGSGRAVLSRVRGRWMRAAIGAIALGIVAFAVIPRSIAERPMRDSGTRMSLPAGVVSVIETRTVTSDEEPEASSHTVSRAPASLDARRHLLALGGVWNAAHFAGFAILGLLLWLGSAGSAWKRVAPCVALAITTELLQHFSPDRSPDLGDVWIDLAGSTAGVAAALVLVVVARLARRR